jgi:protein-disulfide isomerase
VTTPSDDPAPDRILRTLGRHLETARQDLRALEIDRRAAALARFGSAAARATAGIARVQAQRAAQTGGPALRHAWSRSAARLANFTPPRIPRQTRATAAVADPMARPADLPPLPAHAPATRWLEDRRTQMTIAIASLAIAGLGVALATAPPGMAPAPGSTAFGAAVRAYILDHPEIIREAVDKLQQNDSARLLTDNRDALQTPFSGAWAGAPDGDVVLVEFTDYACGFCRASVADIDRLLAEDRKLKVVYREIPILGPNSEDAAIVALSAARQGRHAAVHRALFAAGAPSPAKTAAVAATQKLDTARIASDRTDPVIGREISDNLALARTIGLTGTPTFVIGNRILSGAVGYDALKQAIAEARSGG